VPKNDIPFDEAESDYQSHSRTLSRLAQVKRRLVAALDAAPQAWQSPPEQDVGFERLTKIGPRDRLGVCFETPEFSEALAEIDINVRMIDDALRDGEMHVYRPEERLPPMVPAEGFCLGWVRIRHDFRGIVRGRLQVARDVPIAPSLTQRVVYFLISIGGSDDFLSRENHGHWGYHYHYCNWKEERSDTILCFDAAATREVPLFSEKHAEGNAKFPARPARWKSEKQKSIYFACAPDLKRWPKGPFKTPSKDATLVWRPPQLSKSMASKTNAVRRHHHK